VKFIINSVFIVDLTNKVAKKVPFLSGKNLLTGNNHLGKSLIVKSIFHTLGAEVYYANNIRNINLLTILDFSIDNGSYRICRLNNQFVLYRNDTIVGKYRSVAELSEIISELLQLEIELVNKDENETIAKCPPAFYYLPYYIDQENGWSNNSNSFNKLTQFDLPQRKNSYFFHLGVYDSTFVKMSKEKKTGEKRTNALSQENERLRTVIETLNEGINETQMVFDVKDLEQAIKQRDRDIKKLVGNLAKTRDHLIELEDTFSAREQEKEILERYIKRNKPDELIITPNKIECPKCGSIFESSMVKTLERKYLWESLSSDLVEIKNELLSLEKKCRKYKDQFMRQQKALNDLEQSLTNDKEQYSLYIRSKATRQLLIDYREKMQSNISEIEKIKDTLRGYQKSLNEYNKSRTETNAVYKSFFAGHMKELDIPDDQIGADLEPGAYIVASGAYGPRCKIAQVLSFIQTQNKISPNIVKMPLVIDSPNVLEQDKEHLETTLNTLFTWNETDNQIIVASVEGKEIAEKIDGINVISLSNEKNKLLNESEYLLNQDLINRVIIDI